MLASVMAVSGAGIHTLVQSRAATPSYGPWAPHARPAVQELSERYGIRATTYSGHYPTSSLAADFMTQLDAAKQREMAQYIIDNAERLGVDSLISRQRIWTVSHPYWVYMEDRGSVSENHYDHNHVSFKGRYVYQPAVPPDTAGPEIALLTPAANYEAPLGAGIILNASAMDVSSVSRVEFYNGDALLSTVVRGQDTNYTYSWNTRSHGEGEKILSAKAYDTLGNVSATAAVTVTLRAALVPPPVAKLTAPPTGIIGTTINLIADVLDPAAVSRIEFYEDDRLIDGATESPYFIRWQTAGQTPGTKTLTARAYGKGGLSAISSPVYMDLLASRPEIGDANADKAVNALDLSILRAKHQRQYISGDFNQSGLIDENDMEIMKSKWTW